MSLGKVINGKLAVRDGRLACDCCGPDDPPTPTGGCLPCGVPLQGINNWTAHFANCIGQYTPANPPIRLPGEANQFELPFYLENGWNAPTVTISADLQQTFTSVPPAAPSVKTYTASTSGTLPFVVRRNPQCMTFADYRPQPGQPFYDDRLIIPYQLDDNGSVQNEEMDVSEGHIQLAHNYGYPNGTVPGFCDPFGGDGTVNPSYNLRLIIDPPFGLGNVGGPFSFYAATGTQNPCYGQGFMQSTADPFLGAIIQQPGVFMFGNCSNFLVRWSGSQTFESSSTRSWQFNWSVSLRFSNMATCPEALIV